MKIGMILDNTFPPDPRVENEAAELISHGFEVHLFCMSFKGGCRTESTTCQGIQVTRKYYTPLLRRISALAYSWPFYHLWIRPAIKKFIQENRIDAIHIHDMQAARPVFWINRKLHLPVVLDLHENRPEIMKHYTHVITFPGNILIRPSTWKKFEGKYIARSTRTVVVTEEAKKAYLAYLRLPEDHFMVAPNTVTSAFINDFTIDESITDRYKDRFMVLYIGDTGIRRGIRTVLESVSLLKEEIPGLTFVFLGKSKDDDGIRNYAETLGASPWVEFAGWKDPSSFHSYITASRLCISPLLRNAHHDTTYANKLFQYISMGRPVLVSDCPAQANLVRATGCGLVHQAGNAADFAEKVLSLYHDPEVRMNMGEKGREFILEHFTWDKTSRALISFYRELERAGRMS